MFCLKKKIEAHKLIIGKSINTAVLASLIKFFAA